MELNKPTYLEEDLKGMNSEQLNDLLKKELDKDNRDMDSDLVRQILIVLESREPDRQFVDDKSVEAACDKYRAGCKKRKSPVKKNWILRITSVAAVFALLVLVVPTASGAPNIIEFITKIREDVVAFFSPSQPDNRMECEYHTDHPGLQQIHDAVSKAGITDQVVPSWVPGEYELVELETIMYPTKTRVVACLETAEKAMVIAYDVYGMAATHEHHKDGTPVEEYERAGVKHEIYLNHEKYMAFWTIENVECLIVVDCQEDSLTKILDSIYMMEDK